MAEILACADLAAAMLARPAPVLFLDTAAILDVLRVPFRHEVQADIIDSVATIVDGSSSDPKRIWVVTTANVMQELESRREFVRQELSAHMRDLTLSISRVLTVARTVFPERRIGSLDLLEFKLEQRVSGILDRLVEAMVIFRGTTACVGKARDRVWAGIPPASRAKQEFKDCEIFEEFLDLLTVIRQQGFGPPAIFVTPNSADYGRPPEGHPQIAADLEALGARYATNLSWAYSLISP
jgi:hypothetical protein